MKKLNYFILSLCIMLGVVACDEQDIAPTADSIADVADGESHTFYIVGGKTMEEGEFQAYAAELESKGVRLPANEAYTDRTLAEHTDFHSQYGSWSNTSGNGTIIHFGPVIYTRMAAIYQSVLGLSGNVPYAAGHKWATYHDGNSSQASVLRDYCRNKTALTWSTRSTQETTYSNTGLGYLANSAESIIPFSLGKRIYDTNAQGTGVERFDFGSNGVSKSNTVRRVKTTQNTNSSTLTLDLAASAFSINGNINGVIHVSKTTIETDERIQESGSTITESAILDLTFPSGKTNCIFDIRRIPRLYGKHYKLTSKLEGDLCVRHQRKSGGWGATRVESYRYTNKGYLMYNNPNQFLDVKSEMFATNGNEASEWQVTRRSCR